MLCLSLLVRLHRSVSYSRSATRSDNSRLVIVPLSSRINRIALRRLLLNKWNVSSVVSSTSGSVGESLTPASACVIMRLTHPTDGFMARRFLRGSSTNVDIPTYRSVIVELSKMSYAESTQSTIVGFPDEINDSLKKRVFEYIDKHHYRGIPRQENGQVNAYQYCYGLGCIFDGMQVFGAFVSGYPNHAFQHHCSHIVDQLGNSWVSQNVANIWRIVAHYPDHADSLLAEYEDKAVDRGIKILYSCPTKAEKDAVCNFGWFESNGFTHVADNEGSNGRLYVKQIDTLPSISPTREY